MKHRLIDIRPSKATKTKFARLGLPVPKQVGCSCKQWNYTYKGSSWHEQDEVWEKFNVHCLSKGYKL